MTRRDAYLFLKELARQGTAGRVRNVKRNGAILHPTEEACKRGFDFSDPIDRKREMLGYPPRGEVEP